jgi:hypothetical protein
MAAAQGSGKLLPYVYYARSSSRLAGQVSGRVGGSGMVGLAIAMFIALFGWGAQYFGWADPVGKVQLALFTSFVLGALCGYKSKE